MISSLGAHRDEIYECSRHNANNIPCKTCLQASGGSCKADCDGTRSAAHHDQDSCLTRTIGASRCKYNGLLLQQAVGFWSDPSAVTFFCPCVVHEGVRFGTGACCVGRVLVVLTWRQGCTLMGWAAWTFTSARGMQSSTVEPSSHTHCPSIEHDEYKRGRLLADVLYGMSIQGRV